ncbi:aminotransferase [Reyranella sp.]|uniref:aminotransferase n=1 Tax=Reyranella sp. TaxID=1929291 RepID=UPI002726A395|nr:aminotransferase [Reyranella sp.]MDO8974796.1 aminotransferase [Reyranella sp.]
MKPANSTMAGLGTTVFEVMSALAREHNSVNLGQGFPDDKGPEEVRAAAADYLLNGHNQYPPMMGIPELRQAVAEHARRFQGLEVDWQSEVLVTSGATEALGDCLFGLIEPGDEVVLIEPLYDSYLPIVRRAGGIPRLVRLEPPEWRLPKEELAAAFGPKTKLILFNTPMNPCSKVFDREELSFIAELCVGHDVYAICDEVYEHIIFDDRRHISLMTLPGMRDRTVRIGSAGKSFSLTGWKVGYITAAPGLMTPIARTHQFMTFTTPPNLQWGAATGLRLQDGYFSTLAADMQRKRDRLAGALATIGFDVLPAHGTYFVTTDFRPLGFNGTDEEFCRHITVKAGVTAVPVSAFYQSPEAPRYFARFCFCKHDATLDSAIQRLAAHFGD